MKEDRRTVFQRNRLLSFFFELRYAPNASSKWQTYLAAVSIEEAAKAGKF